MQKTETQCEALVNKLEKAKQAMAEVETEISENATPLTAARKEHDDAHTALRAMEPPAAVQSDLPQPSTSPSKVPRTDPYDIIAALAE